MNINDLSVLLAAIDIAVKRGAFSILELSQVGDVATKLNTFLQSAKEQAEKAQAEADATAGTSTEAATEQPAA